MDFGVWEGVFVQAALDDQAKARVWLDVHARRDGDRFVGIVRPGIGWSLAPRLVVYAGYAWIPSAVPGAPLSSEHRIWQQLLWSADVGPVGFGVRPRFEQRFGSGDVGLRGRVFTRVQVKVKDPVSLVVWDEPFVGFNDTALGPAGFDQNRLFVGPALQTDLARFELGWLDQRVLRDGDWSPVEAVAMFAYLAF